MWVVKLRGVKDDSKERCLVSSWIYETGIRGTSPGQRCIFERHKHIGGKVTGQRTWRAGRDREGSGDGEEPN